MSEFQAYKFRSVDRLLTPTERDEISSWSSRTHASASGATFTYSYGNFPKKEEQVLRDYFDVFLYFSNWGTKRLMLKFPKDLVDFRTLKLYTINADHAYTTHLEVAESDKHLIIDFYWADDESGYWAEEDDYEIADFIGVREAILNGDYSAMYLYWLKLAKLKVAWGEVEDENFEVDAKTPPIPSQLKHIGTSLQSFAELLSIDGDLVEAAKSASKELAQEEIEKDYKSLLQQLSAEEKEDYLWQLLQGVPRIDLKLKQQLDRFAPASKVVRKSISLADMQKKQEAERKMREAAEHKAAVQKHREKMEKIAQERELHWKSVFTNLDLKQGGAYDRATATLVDLKALAAYENRAAEFEEKMRQIKKDYGRSRVLLNRFSKAKL